MAVVSLGLLLAVIMPDVPWAIVATTVRFYIRPLVVLVPFRYSMVVDFWCVKAANVFASPLGLRLYGCFRWIPTTRLSLSTRRCQ